ncbi:MAG: MlaE family ABC transporter permease [Vampirovibrionales bacterium]
MPTTPSLRYVFMRRLRRLARWDTWFNMHPRAWFPLTRLIATTLLHFMTMLLIQLGRFGEAFTLMGRYVLRRQVSWQATLEQMAKTGFSTLPVALILSGFTGMVMAMQFAQPLIDQGAGGVIGGLVAFALVRELAGVFTGFAFIAMAGSAFTSELGAMSLSSQLAALRMMGIHPVRHLQAPRVLASMMMLPMLTFFAAFVGILAGGIVTMLNTPITWHQYMTGVSGQLELRDLLILWIRMTLFGYLIAVLCSDAGLRTKGGTQELGNATSEGVVQSFVAMALTNFLVSAIAYT